MVEVAERKPLSGRIVGVHEGPVAIARDSIVEDAEFLAAGSSNLAGSLVEQEGPVLWQGGRVFAPGYRRGVSAEIVGSGLPASASDITRMFDVEISGAVKAVVGHRMWLRRCAITECGEDGLFMGLGGYVLAEECDIIKLGTGGPAVHADAFQMVGGTGLVVKRCTIYMPHPLSPEGDPDHQSNAAFIGKGRSAALGTVWLFENRIPAFGNWAIYWERDVFGVSPFGGLWVKGNAFGRMHRPASSPPILSTDAPETVMWESNTYAGEPYTPPQIWRAA